MKSVVSGAITGFVVSVAGLSVLSVLVPPNPPVAQTSAPAAASLPAMQPQARAPKPAEGAPKVAPLSGEKPAPAPAEGAPKVPLAGPAPGAGAAPSAPLASPQVPAGPEAPAAGSAAPAGAETSVAPIAPAPADRVPAPAKIVAAPGMSPQAQPSPAPSAGTPPEAPQAMGGEAAAAALPAPPAPGASDSAPSAERSPMAPAAADVAPAAPAAAPEGASAAPATSGVATAAPAPSPAAPTMPQAAAPDGAARPVEGAQALPRVLALPAPPAKAPATSSLPQVGGPAKTANLPGVPSGRLPQITGPAAGQDAAGLSMPGTHVSGLPGQPVAPLVGTGPAATPAPPGTVKANAAIRLPHTQPAANPDRKPEMAIILIDDGRKTLDRSILSQTKLPVTYAVDPLEADAGKWAADYVGGGHEVLLAMRPLPERMSPSALDAALQDYFRAVPQALGLMDAPAKGFQGDRRQSQQLVGLLAVAGRGLVTYDHGLNTASQVAQGAGLPETMISSALMNGDTEALRILLDRAAFRAAQQGRIVVAAPARTSVLAAIADWTKSLRGKTVALVPVSALMEK
ncbi:MAG: divergent polysaccharide deacetylase family protein [Paracoccaceae bacterium]|nr:divergent polysaccharide deacetylase family protein [Paracoccaceae bacterium]